MLKTSRRHELIIAVSVSLTSFLLYLISLRNGFVWDDFDYVSGNPYISFLNDSFFRWAFLEFYAANWHPLTWISHAIDYAFWGLNPVGHHLTNNILHSINTFLVVLLVMRLIEFVTPLSAVSYQPSAKSDSRSVVDDSHLTSDGSGFTLVAAGVTGLLFGIHPIHVESVAWVAERKDLLCALFYLLSVMMYIKGRLAAMGNGQSAIDEIKTKVPIAYRLSPIACHSLAFGFFILALMSKPMAVSLPVVLLILDWYPFKRIKSLKSFVPAFVEKMPFMALSLISSLLTLRAQTAGGATELMEVFPLSTRLLVAARTVIIYLEKMVLPVRLLPYYPYPEDISLSSPEYFLPVLLFLGITAACLAAAGKLRLLLAVWSYYLITLIPVAGIVQVGEQSMADRYTYLPGLGPFLLVGLLTALFFGRGENLKGLTMIRKLSGIAAACLLVLSLAFLTFKQIGIWKNSISLWTYVIEEEPARVPLAYNNRGLAFSAEGNYPEAIRDFSKAIALDPYRYRPYNNRGEVLGKLGRFNEALSDYSAALALNQNDAKVFVNRGLVYFSVGQDQLAAFHFDRACELGDPFGCNLAQYIESMGHKQ